MAAATLAASIMLSALAASAAVPHRAVAFDDWELVSEGMIGGLEDRQVYGPFKNLNDFPVFWTPTVAITSHFTVTGPANNELPSPGPNWGMLFANTSNNPPWTDYWTGSRLIQPDESWVVKARFDERVGYQTFKYVPSGQQYTRNLDMDVYEPEAWFQLVPGDPGPEG